MSRPAGPALDQAALDVVEIVHDGRSPLTLAVIGMHPAAVAAVSLTVGVGAAWVSSALAGPLALVPATAALGGVTWACRTHGRGQQMLGAARRLLASGRPEVEVVEMLHATGGCPRDLAAALERV